MSLPLFNSQGLLPDAVHQATLDELRVRCVDDFVGSVTRRGIFANFLRFRNTLTSLGLSLTQWIDGSFVDQTRRDPLDVDVVSFCDSQLFRTLPHNDRERAIALLDNSAATELDYQVHSFLVMEFPYDHELWGKFENQRRYWRRQFSQPLDYSGPNKQPTPRRGRKGIVQITLGDVTLCPRIDSSL
jgi:hypothetical protein